MAAWARGPCFRQFTPAPCSKPQWRQHAPGPGGHRLRAGRSPRSPPDRWIRPRFERPPSARPSCPCSPWDAPVPARAGGGHGAPADFRLESCRHRRGSLFQNPDVDGRACAAKSRRCPGAASPAEPRRRPLPSSFASPRYKPLPTCNLNRTCSWGCNFSAARMQMKPYPFAHLRQLSRSF